MLNLILYLIALTVFSLVTWLWLVTRDRPTGAEVVDFEPSPEFKMPEAMGIDYMGERAGVIVNPPYPPD